MVVPMLAPKMMVAAWTSDMIPALTKPIVMTVVAPELWMAAVATAPIPTPSHLLPDIFANSARSLLLLTASRLELIMEQAIRKIPIPARSVRIALTTKVILIILPFPLKQKETLTAGRNFPAFYSKSLASYDMFRGFLPVLTKACHRAGALQATPYYFAQLMY